MEAVLILLVTICLGLSQKEGSRYEEIALFDEMVTEKYKQATPQQPTQPPQTSQIPPTQQPRQGMPVQPPQNKPTPPPMGQPKGATPQGFGTPKSPSIPQKPSPKKANDEDIDLDGFDFQDILSATIDENAFKEIEKQR